MKRATLLCLFLSLSALIVMAGVSQKPAQDNSFQTFWQKFRGAVINGDKEAAASLARYPVGMSYGVASIKNKAQFIRRYRELFNKQTDAAACFRKARPEPDAENSKRFSVACPDAAGNEVVIFTFEQTKAGWRFTSLDNINE